MTHSDGPIVRVSAVAVGCTVGVILALAGARALVVSRGTVGDWALISGIFFATLPASLLGLVAPRIAGIFLAVVALVAAVTVSVQEGMLPWRLWVIYTAPAVVVALALIWTAKAKNRSSISERTRVVA
jgi:hypothetical protein